MRKHCKAEGVIDKCIQPIVEALNSGGVETKASCCGHGNQPGSIVLKDNRELILADSFEMAREIETHFPLDINGDRKKTMEQLRSEQEATIKRLTKDKERLDWLEDSGLRPLRLLSLKWQLQHPTGQRASSGSSLRAAIDKAMGDGEGK